MNKILCLFGYMVVLVIPGSFGTLNDGILQVSSADIFGAAYNDGYRQILAASLSPKCKEKALEKLAATRKTDSQMNCTGWVNNLKDIGEIGETALESIGQLLEDLNTVLNSVPVCWGSKSTFNIPGKIACVFSQFGNIWNALKDFWNFKDYVRGTAEIIKEYEDCVRYNKDAVSKSVQIIVETAKLCR